MVFSHCDSSRIFLVYPGFSVLWLRTLPTPDTLSIFRPQKKKEEGKNKYVIVERYDGANGLGFAMIWKAERAGTVALGTGR